MSGGTLHALTRLGLRHIPFGAGNIQGLMPAAQFLKSTVPRFWPSDGLYLGGRAAERGIDAVIGSVDRMLLAGEPGVGEPAMRARLEAAWGARVADA
ncbi:hypothetical protein HKCCSP123_03895 [Rhodobacterales bacterium HKCCSP123]|nr:hypothetical protein [Rhodobacterales bacterium HKCCSP123]